MLQCEQDSCNELLHAVEQFNQGDWMGAHHTLDKLYMEEKGEVRCLFQAVIQVGAALIHWERGNYAGATTLLERAGFHLAEVRPVCQGVDVADFAKETARFREALQSLGPGRFGQLDRDVIPRLRLVGKDGAERPVDCSTT